MYQNSSSWVFQMIQNFSLSSLDYLTMYLVNAGKPAHHFGSLLLTPPSHPHGLFLSNLSLADIGFISTTVPKMIVNIQSLTAESSPMQAVGRDVHFYPLWRDGLYFCLWWPMTGQAICHPLHYQVIMNPCNLQQINFRVFFLLAFWTPKCRIWLCYNLRASRMWKYLIFSVTLLNCSTYLFWHVTNNIVMYFVGAIFGFIPFSGIFFSTVKFFPPFLEATHQ